MLKLEQSTVYSRRVANLARALRCHVDPRHHNTTFLPLRLAKDHFGAAGVYEKNQMSTSRREDKRKRKKTYLNEINR